MVKFQKCDFNEIKERVCKYYIENDILVDSYWEANVIESNFYNIIFDGETIGFCGINNKSLITLFNIEKSYNYLAQDIFMKAKHLEEVSEAFVVTGDELLLSLCMDNFSRIDKQAYFTRDLDLNNSENDVTLRIAKATDAELVAKYSDDFFDDIDKEIIKGGIYIAEKDNEIVGFGVIEAGVLREDLQSIGMFVRQEFRQRGFATKILKGLKVIVKANGKKPISGCWYYNHNSLKSQFKAGNYCCTRLLRVKF